MQGRNELFKHHERRQLVALQGRDCEPEECLEGAEILAGLRFTSWASTVAVASASSGAVICKFPCPQAMQEQREASDDDGESEGAPEASWAHLPIGHLQLA